MIKPTIGRVVLVHRFEDGKPLSDQPEPALICYVHDDRTINVGGFDRFGCPFEAEEIAILQDDDIPPIEMITGEMISCAYAEWMPYQKQVAAGQVAPVQHAQD